MTRDEYVQSIDPGKFAEICLQLWDKDGSPVLNGMDGIIFEEYNNAAIEQIEAEYDRDESINGESEEHDNTEQ